MKLVVGLGNPGRKYEKTRHNVGFVVVDELIKSQISQPKASTMGRSVSGGGQPRAEKLKAQSYISNSKTFRKYQTQLVRLGDLLLAKPQTFMNQSGKAVSRLRRFYKVSLDNLYIVHDDLDICLGEYKIQKERGPREHKGLMSAEQALGAKDFWRVRIGVENRKVKSSDRAIQVEEERIPGEVYVLQRFRKDEKRVIDAVVKKVVEDLGRRVLD